MIMDTPSFTSRRPATTGLPPFNLPQSRPQEIPSMQNNPSDAAAPPAVASDAPPHVSPGAGHLESQVFFSPAGRADASGSQAVGPPGSSPAGAASLQVHHPLPSVSSVLTPPTGVVSSEGLSPLSSTTNSGSSQSSHAAPTQASSYYQQQAGHWPAPGSNSGYTLSSIASQNQSQSQSNPLVQPPSSYHGGSRSQAFSPNMQYSSFRSTQPSSGADNMSIASFTDPLPPFSTSLGAGGGGGLSTTPPTLPSQPHSTLQSSILGSHSSASQAQPPGSSSSDAYRHRGYQGYPATSNAAQSAYTAYASHPSQSHPSPTTSAGMSSGIPSMAGHTPGLNGMVHGTLPYHHGTPRQHQAHHQYSYQHHIPVMSNVGNPSGPMSMIGATGVYGMAHHHQHMYHHSDPGNLKLHDRPFRCDQCNQSFNRNHDLKRHKRIHLAVKPFPCTFCDKSFSRKDALKRHRLVKGCGKPSEGASNNQEGGEDVKLEDGKSESDATEPSPKSTYL